jgi:L-iditol 2-dehydrogenase
MSMKALQFGISIPRILMARALGRFTDAVVFGPLSGLSLVDIPVPALPGPDWARVEVLMCGICGSDIAGSQFTTSPVLEPFLSLPAVLGHELLGRVIEVGPTAHRVKVGDRVVLDPTISCTVRGRSSAEQCASCAAGLPTTCSRAGEAGGPSVNGAPLARGLLIGAHADLPGGFSEQIIAHHSQLYVVPDAVTDDVAVLTEPLSIGVHAVLQTQPDPTAAVLVIGSGPIAMAAIWALRALGLNGRIVAQTKRPSEAALARDLGASDTVAPGAAATAVLLETGATAYNPIIGPAVFAGGGFPIVFDCVGSTESLDQALRSVAPRGKIVLLGCAGELDGLDLSFLWAREIQVVGYVGYGTETWRGAQRHTFEIAHQLMTETAAPLGQLLTHHFPLSRYREAFSAAAHRRVSGAMKVVLTPD